MVRKLLALTEKNLILCRRVPLLMTAMVVPAVALSILTIVAISIQSAQPGDRYSPFSVPYSKCTFTDAYGNSDPPSGAIECISVVYAPSSPFIDDVMLNKLAPVANLKPGTDIIGFISVDEMFSFSAQLYGSLDSVVIFSNNNPSNVSYTLMYNESASAGSSGYFTTDPPGRIVSLQALIDSALISSSPSSPSPLSVQHEVSYQIFNTKIINNENGNNGGNNGGGDPYFQALQFEPIKDKVMAYGGSINVIIGNCVAMLLLMSVVTNEKRLKLFNAMKMMGLPDSAFWLSWLFLFLLLAVGAALCSFIVGISTGFHIFERTSFPIILLTLTLFLTSMAALGLFIGSFVTQSKWLNFSALGVFIVAVVFTAVIGFQAQVLYAPTTAPGLTGLVSVFPWFHLSKIWGDFVTRTTDTYELSTATGQLTLVGQTYGWSELSDRRYVVGCQYSGCCNTSPNQCFYIPSTGYSLGMLTLLIFLYTTLAWYCGQCFGPSGSRRPIYFIVLPSYWNCCESAREFVVGDTVTQVQQESATEHTIRTHKLTKSFENVTAVKELSVTMRMNEIFALLGANGSGKTTTISMLSGLLEPTFGEAFIFGLDVRTRAAAIQKLVGSCTQEDLLWNQLTVLEHANLVATLRGVSKEDARAALVSVDLLDSKDKQAGVLSGGMKRRLSLALAIIGDTKILLCDEVNSGIDPLNALQIREILRKLKQNRLILLTTHSMEEADSLGDTVAILSNGRLRAVGTSLHLKNRFGTGYQLRILSSSPSSVEHLKKKVSELLPSADIVDVTGASLTLGLPRKALASLPSFFQWIDAEQQKKQGVQIREWSIANSTLEEVFLRLCSAEKTNEVVMDFEKKELQDSLKMCQVCQKREAQTVTLYTQANIPVTVSNVICDVCAQGGEQQTNNRDDTETKDQEEVSEMRVPDVETFENKREDTANYDDAVPMMMTKSKSLKGVSLVSAIYAVALKNLALLGTSRRALYGKIILTLVGILILFFVTPRGPPSDVCPQGWSSSNSSYMSCDTSTLKQLLLNLSTINVQYNLDQPIQCFPPPAAVLPTWDYYGWQGNQFNVWYTDAKTTTTTTTKTTIKLNETNLLGLGAGILNDCGMQFVSRSSYAGSIEDQVFQSSSWYLGNVTAAPAFCTNSSTNPNGRGYGQLPAYWVQNQTQAQSILQQLYPDFAISIEQFEYDEIQSSIKLRYIYYVYDNHCNCFPQIFYVNNVNNPNNICGSNGPQFYNRWYSRQSYVVNGMSNMLARTFLQANNQSSITPILTQMTPLRNPNYLVPIGSGAIYATLTWVTFLSLLLMPDIVTRIVSEREEPDLLFMMHLLGMKSWLFFLANWVYDFLLIFGFGLVLLVVCFLFGIVVVTNNIGTFILIYAVWSQVQIAMAMFLSSILRKQSVATVIAYFLLLAMTVAVPILDLFNDTWTAPILLLPPVGFARCLGLYARYGQAGAQLGQAIGMLFLGSVLLHLLAFVLFYPTQTYNALTSIFKCNTKTSSQTRNNAIVEKEPLVMATRKVVDIDDDNDAATMEFDDEDVAHERKLVDDIVRQNQGGHQYPLVVSNLRKVFGDDLVAVRKLSFAVEAGQVFGLLGSNGAGKTTALNIVTQYLSSTSGTAYVCGNDVQDTSVDLSGSLGVCFQFDRLWAELTVRQHLLFFVRMRGGISGSFANALVQQIAESVELDGDSLDKQSSELSGGQRRRLSIGISLVSGPSVLLLDEPSTGLSPDARRQVWRIIERLKQDKRHSTAIVLTTHLMEEADALCSRIGIMSKGVLKCIGSQAHLKAKFSDGFSLDLSVKDFLGVDPITKAHLDYFNNRGHRPSASLAEKEMKEFNNNYGSTISITTSASVSLQHLQPDAIMTYLTKLMDYLRKNISEQVELNQAQGRNVRFTIKSDILNCFKIVSEQEQQLKRLFGVQEWGISQTTLEEVFIRAVQ